MSERKEVIIIKKGRGRKNLNKVCGQNVANA